MGEIHTGINKEFLKVSGSSREEKKHAYKSLEMASVSNIYGLFYIFRSYFHLVFYGTTSAGRGAGNGM